MMKNILFVKPFAGRKTGDISPPMGLIYLSSYIKNRFPGLYDIKLIDMRFRGNDSKKLEAIIDSFEPELVGISACSEEDTALHEIASIVKFKNANIKVVVGGPHPTMCYEDVLKDINVDFAVVGEGELAFAGLLEAVCSGKTPEDLKRIKGIAFITPLGLSVNIPAELISNLDELPYPDWYLLDFDQYSSALVVNMNEILAGKKYMAIVSSRGCPYQCIYCHNIFGKEFRKRSAVNIVKEMELLVQEFAVDEFQIFDDIFNLDETRLIQICDLIIKSGLKIKLSFPNGIRGDLLNEKTIVKLKAAGAYMLTFALETASPRLQKLIKKNIDKEKLLENIKFADSLGMLTKCFFMLGFPTETKAEIQATIDFACNAPLCFAGFFIVTPQRGTELFYMVTDMYPQFIPDHYLLNNYYASNSNYEKIQGLPLKKMQLYALRKFYFNPKRLIKLYSRIPAKHRIFMNMFKYGRYFF